jgi:hypothetical protein
MKEGEGEETSGESKRDGNNDDQGSSARIHGDCISSFGKVLGKRKWNGTYMPKIRITIKSRIRRRRAKLETSQLVGQETGAT